MESYNNERILSGFRIKRIVRDRLKTLAKEKKTSVNELVDEALSELTKNVRTSEEVKEERKKTEEFLSVCMGKWEGLEYESSVDAVKKIRITNEPVSL